VCAVTVTVTEVGTHSIPVINPSGVSAAFMVGGGNEEGTLEGKKKSL